MTLKYENVAKVGDRIRSYDFYGTDCYIEGKVLRVTDETGFMAFAVEVDKDYCPVETARRWPGRVGITVFVPLEVSFMEYDGRIVNLTKEKQ